MSGGSGGLPPIQETLRCSKRLSGDRRETRKSVHAKVNEHIFTAKRQATDYKPAQQPNKELTAKVAKGAAAAYADDLRNLLLPSGRGKK